MGHFVHVQNVGVKVGSLVYETPIFRAHTKIASEIAVDSAAV